MNSTAPFNPKDLRISTYLDTKEKWVNDGMSEEEAIRTYRELQGCCQVCGGHLEGLKEMGMDCFHPQR